MQPSERLAESDWLVPRLRAFASGVTSIVPDGFPAYVWDGYGRQHGTSASAIFSPAGMRATPPPAAEHRRYDFAATSRVRLSYRAYLLFEGPLDAAIDTDWSPGGGIFPQSPNLFWPQDHAWCVASEIDLYATVVGGPQTPADALVANPALEAWHVEPDDPVTSDGDRINR